MRTHESPRPIIPHLKMISADFVGEVKADQIRPGDLILQGMVYDVERDGDEYLIETVDNLLAVKPYDPVMRFGRLTAVAFDDIGRPAFERARGIDRQQGRT